MKDHRLNLLQLIAVITCSLIFLMFAFAEITQPDFETPVFVWPIIGGTYGIVMGFSYKPTKGDDKDAS